MFECGRHVFSLSAYNKFTAHITHTARTQHSTVPLSRQFVRSPPGLLTRSLPSSTTISPTHPITLRNHGTATYANLVLPNSAYGHLKNIAVPHLCRESIWYYPQCLRSPYKHHTTYPRACASCSQGSGRRACMTPEVKRWCDSSVLLREH